MNENKLNDKEITELGNPKKPEGEYGKLMLKRMNKDHKPLVEFALGFLNFKNDDVILDIGCGGGATINLINQYNKNAKIYGLDYSNVSIQETKELNKELIDNGMLELNLADVEAMPYSNDTFTKIMTVESFYFWKNQKENIKEVYRVLKPHGHFVIACDVYDTINLTKEEKDNVSKYGLKVRTEAEFEELFNQAGFKDIRIHKKDDKNWIIVDGQKKIK